MKRFNYILLLLLFCSFAVSLRGQVGQYDLSKLIEKKVELEKSIIKLEKSIQTLTKDSARINQNIAFQVQQIPEDSIKLFNLQERVHNLEKSVNSIGSLKMEIGDLEKESKRLDSLLIDLKGEVDQVKNDIKAKDCDLQGKTVYADIAKENKRKKLYQDINAYLGTVYSKMDQTVLQDYKKELSDDPDNMQLMARLSKTIENKGVYDRGVGYVNRGGGDPNTIKDVRYKMDSMYRSTEYKLTEGQKAELEDLNILLSRVNNGTKALQGIVNAINADEKIKEIRESKGTESAAEYESKIDSYINPNKGNEVFKKQYQRYFDKIPFLKNLLREYYHELKKKPKQVPTKTEIIIMKLPVK